MQHCSRWLRRCQKPDCVAKNDEIEGVIRRDTQWLNFRGVHVDRLREMAKEFDKGPGKRVWGDRLNLLENDLNIGTLDQGFGDRVDDAAQLPGL